MTYEAIIGILIFFIPGFIITHIARLIHPNYYNKDSWGSATSIILASSIVYLSLSKTPLGGNIFKGDATNKASVLITLFDESPMNFLWIVLISFGVGIIWGLVAPAILHWFYILKANILNKKTHSYVGDKPLWDRFFEKNQNKWFDIHLKSTDVYLKADLVLRCQIIANSTYPESESILITNINQVHPKNTIEPFPYYPSLKNEMLIKLSEIKFIVVHNKE